MFTVARLSWVLLTFISCEIWIASPAQGQLPRADRGNAKARLAIRRIAPTDSVQAEAKTHGQDGALQLICDAIDSQLLNAIEQTRKFEIVARKDLPELQKERDLKDSGLGASEDPQAAKSSELKAASYTLTVTIDSFQDVVTRAQLEGQLGASMGERREIQIQAVVKIFDSSEETLVRSSSQEFTMKQVAEVPVGQQRDGRATNKLLGDVAKAVSVYGANQITDFVFPPKVMDYTDGIMTFNRTKESGVSRDQWWEVFAPGKELFDPDTGESQGAAEIHIGWAKIIDAGSKNSKAQGFGDNGISCGSILRLCEAAPEDASRLEKSNGFCDEPGEAPPPSRNAPSGAPPAGGAPRSNDVAPIPSVPLPAAGSSDGSAVATSEKPLRLAIFIKNRAKDVNDEMVMVLEDAIISAATCPEIEIIPREDVVNAVSRFAKAGANVGTGDPKALDIDKVLSDQTSAANLALNMGADTTLIGSIVSLTKTTKHIKDADIKIDYIVHSQKLTVAYRILNGGTGGALAAGDVVVGAQWKSGGNLTQDAPPIEDTLRDAGIQLADKMRAAIFTGKMRKPTDVKQDLLVTVRTTIVDLVIPEIVMEEGKPILSSGTYKLEPTAVNIYVDGLLLGAAPGEFSIRPGLHRIKCERPMFKTFEGMLSVRPNQALLIPMQLTDEGLARMKENAKFFQDMKERAALSEAQVEVAKGYAEFLRQSSIKIDTGNLRELKVGGDFWGDLFKELQK